MRLKIFQSDGGDCLLLEGSSGRTMLCDGGMRKSFATFVRPELAKLRAQGRTLDLIYVSHIDNDHITGVLQLLEDEVEWRVYDFHVKNGDTVKKPKVPRPPEIGGILHNAFRDMVSKNPKELENQLVASAPVLYATAIKDLITAADHMQGIAAGIPDALKVSGLVKKEALNIPVNRPPGVEEPSRLLFAGQPGDQFELGSMRFTLLGPTEEELTQLRKGWNNWLRDPKNKDNLRKIREELKRRIEEFSNGILTTSPYDLHDWNGIPPFKGVTAPNVASLMFLVEEDGHTLLLTGDGQQDLILAGLERTGNLDDGFLHVDVLKVQHHGSESNMDENFAQRVSADHYVFCGNGSHTNPDRKVIRQIFASRMSDDPSIRAKAPEAQDNEFHFWFSTSLDVADETTEAGQNFRESVELVEELAAQSGGRLHLHFNDQAAIELNVP